MSVSTPNNKKLVLVSGRAHPELAQEVAELLGTKLTETVAYDFANGETFVRYEESVRGVDAFVIQAHPYPINQHMMEQLLMCDALKRASAKRITVVSPFFPYARQDKKHKGREPISARLMADLYKASGANRLMSVDLHTPQIQGFFDGPVDHLWALPILADYVAEKYAGENLTVVSPDSGRVRVADIWADRLGAPLAIIHKRRDPDRPNQVQVHELVGDVEGRTCLLVDDMIDTAGTIVAAAKALKENGAGRVIVAATHAIFSNPAVERLTSDAVDEVVVTNSLPIPAEKQFETLTVLSIAPLIAGAIEAVFSDDSVSRFFLATPKPKTMQPKQQIGLIGAVAIGLASMLGAGVFVVFHTAYAITPTGYYWALGLAALVAVLNSWSVYSLARKVDRPGGVYAYSRIYLNDTFSFASGFAFVFGKIGSIAAIALAFNTYLLPQYRFWPAAVAIAALTLINILGIQRTAGVAAVLAVTTSAYFVFISVSGLVTKAPMLVLPAPNAVPAPLQILSAAAIFFFAFAGYARVATLGNEVRDAKRNIPRAIVIALGLVMVLYGVLAFVMVKFLGLNLLTADAPFTLLGERLIPGGVEIAAPLTISVAVVASLGSMLALLAGVSRTAASMGEDRELPKFFQLRNSHGSPWLAEVIIAAGAIGLVAVGDLSWVIGFSSFSVLFYYSIGHISVLRQTPNERVSPVGVAVIGFVLCWALALTVPGPAVPVSLGILAVALLVRFIVKRARG